jgi:hypothetical protein
MTVNDLNHDLVTEIETYFFLIYMLDTNKDDFFF